MLFLLLSLGMCLLSSFGMDAAASLRRDYSITVFDQAAGLSDYALASVAATPDGMLWYCSFGAVGRFNGTQFSDLSAADNWPRPSARPRKLLADRQGRLWVGTAGRILCREKGTWRTFGMAEGVPPELIRELTEGPSGTVWAASVSNIICLAGDRFRSLPAPIGVDEERCGLAVDATGTVWCAGTEYLSRFDDGRWSVVLSPPETRTNRIRGVLAARGGGLWVAFEKDVRLRTGENWTKTWPRPADQSGDVVQMLEDSQGNLWTGGWRSGVVVFDRYGKTRRATTAEGLANNSVSDLTEDREGNIWLSSNGGGLVRLRPLVFRSYGQEAGLSQIANSVSEASPGKLWVGTHGDGLAQLENERFSPPVWPETNFLAGLWVHGVLQDRAGDVWVATYSPGLLRLHNGAWARIPKEITGARITNCLIEDRQDRIWIGMSPGLARWEDGAIRVVRPEDGLPPISVRGITQDGEGNIWVCGPGQGLFRGQATNFARVPLPGVEANADFQALLTGRDGSVWISIADRGLAHFKKGQCFVFGREQGLAMTDCTALLEDDKGDLWLGGPKGVVRVIGSSLEAVSRRTQDFLECQMFDTEDGLPGSIRGGFQPVCWKASDGRLWFATFRGIAVVDPKVVQPPLPPPRVEISQVRINGNLVEESWDDAKLLQIPAGNRLLDVSYFAVRLGTPQRLRFQRRLRPEQAWENVGDEHSAHLDNLRPGRYRFEVRAADTEGVWGKSAVLNWVVARHFWEEKWFVALVFAGLCLSVWQFHRRRLAILDERRTVQADFARKLIDREEQWRHKTAVDLHDGLGQLLQVICNRAAMAVSASHGPDATAHLEAITDTAKQAVSEARDIVRSLRPHYLEQLGLTRSMHYLLTQTAQASPVVWERSMDPIDDMLPPEQCIHLYRVVQECVTNVIRHSGASHAGLVVRRQPDSLSVDVWDNGKGLPPSNKQEPGAASNGLGLQSIRERVHLLGGEYRFMPGLYCPIPEPRQCPDAGKCPFCRNQQCGLIVSIRIPVTRPAS